jgi:DNA-binding NtrC family response regulator
MGKPTILVVDDDPMCLKAMVRALSGECRVVTADGIFEAVARVSTEDIEAILSDYEMPFGDGLQVISSLRSMGHDVPAAIVTGAYENVKLREALQAGVIDEVVDKPFAAEALLGAVRRMLESRQARPRADSDAPAHSVLRPLSKATETGKTGSSSS